MSEAQRNELTVSAGSEYQCLRLRVTALYHNCLSAAAFKREDAIKCGDGDGDEATALRREASAYECCAEWLRNADK